MEKCATRFRTFADQLPSVLQPFLHNRSFLESVGPNCPNKALMSKNEKGPHVRRFTILPLKIGEEQKKYSHAARCLPSCGVEEFFL